jgi:prepilin-type N-terminal cleavage/methylation domain-containing protein/prepilin-type processing-associated H-X9-DG protein
MHKQRGFTLVELLVVIAIIALLMSILMPALAKAKKQAIIVLDQSNQKQLGTSFSGYTNDNDGYFWKGWGGSQPETSQWWMDAARSYYGNNKAIRCCPLAANPDDSDNIWNMCWNFPTTPPPFRAGCERTPPIPDYGSYGTSGWVENQPDPPAYGQAAWYWRTMDVKGAIAKDVPLLFDEWNWIDTWPLDTDEPPEYDNMPWGSGSMMGRICKNRHDGYINMLFLDLGVRKVGLKELWMLKWHRNFNNTTGPWSYRVKTTNWPKWMRDFKNYAR